MENIIDEVFDFIKQTRIIDNYIETPAGIIHYAPIRHIKFGHLHLTAGGNAGLGRKNNIGFTFLFSDRLPTEINRSIVALVYTDIKIIKSKSKILYNGEFIKQIEIFSDGTFKVTTHEGAVTTVTSDGEKTTVKPDGTKLTLKPSGLLTVITAEGVTTVLSETASVATIAMLILMIADMWSRKEKKSQISTPNPKSSEKLGEIKEIAVLMSDGTRPSFKSWRHNPDEVKKFVEMF